MNIKSQNSNTFLLQIINSIKKEYPLTLIQKLKITIIQDSIINNNSNNQYINICMNKDLNKIVKDIFTLIIKPTDNKTNNKFYEYVTESTIEFYTFKHCIKHNIMFEPNIEYILFFRELTEGIYNINEKELESTIFRSSSQSLINLSNNGEKLYKQFKENSKQKKYTKKEMN